MIFAFYITKYDPNCRKTGRTVSSISRAHETSTRAHTPQERVQTRWLDHCRRSSVLRTMGNSLTFQLLEGARFLHEHKVAQLDLKPASVVITATKRLRLIDFISILISKLGSWAVGHNGTERVGSSGPGTCSR